MRIIAQVHLQVFRGRIQLKRSLSRSQKNNASKLNSLMRFTIKSCSRGRVLKLKTRGVDMRSVQVIMAPPLKTKKTYSLVSTRDIIEKVKIEVALLTKQRWNRMPLSFQEAAKTIFLHLAI
jgi:hypothetical protein